MIGDDRAGVGKAVTKVEDGGAAGDPQPMLTTETLARLRTLAAQATRAQGSGTQSCHPWVVDEVRHGYDCVIRNRQQDPIAIVPIAGWGLRSGGTLCAWIAACDPQTILKLVAEVERLRAIEKEHHSDWCVSWTKQLEDLRERAAQVAAGAARICDGPIANMCIAVARDIRALPLVAPEEKP